MVSFGDVAARPVHNWSVHQEAIFRDAREGDGHTVVIARAGSGKTTTIVEALRHVPRGAGSLLVAFNKSIGRELSGKAPRGVEVRTLHSFGLKTITNALGKIEVDAQKVPKLIRKHLGDDLTAEQQHALCKGVELAKATLAQTEEDVRQLVDKFDLDVPEGEKQAFAELVLGLLDTCAEQSACVNYDDMVWLPVRLGLHPRRFDRVFVDEMQDLNRGQVELALMASRRGGRICAVGDDRQAIYSWRSAEPEGIPRLIGRLDAKVLHLSATYRCARRIVALAREIVPDL